jgi:hypothetical protein
MSITLNLEPQLLQRLQHEAEREGVPLETWLQRDLAERSQATRSEAALLKIITAGFTASFWERVTTNWFKALTGLKN